MRLYGFSDCLLWLDRALLLSGSVPHFSLSRHSPFELMKHQFSIKLAFAMKINKSQGRTFDFIGLDLIVEVFVHRQL